MSSFIKLNVLTHWSNEYRTGRKKKGIGILFKNTKGKFKCGL